MRCKNLESGYLFDAMMWSGDVVIVRPASPDPQEDIYLLSLKDFAENFGAIGD